LRTGASEHACKWEGDRRGSNPRPPLEPQSAEGVRTTFGSLVYKDFLAERDALIVKRLREAGAICVGKTNTQEFQDLASPCGMKIQDYRPVKKS
jgi:Amidase